MKSNLYLCAAACLLLNACSLLNSPSQETIEDVSFGVQIAANTGGQLALAQDPSLRPKFEKAVVALDILIEGTNYSPFALYTILNTLGIKELKSPYASILVGASEVAFHRYAKKYPLQTPELVRAASMAMRDGLRQALLSTPNQNGTHISPRGEELLFSAKECSAADAVAPGTAHFDSRSGVLTSAGEIVQPWGSTFRQWPPPEWSTSPYAIYRMIQPYVIEDVNYNLKERNQYELYRIIGTTLELFSTFTTGTEPDTADHVIDFSFPVYHLPGYDHRPVLVDVGPAE
jgi:hypothetical protein